MLLGKVYVSASFERLVETSNPETSSVFRYSFFVMTHWPKALLSSLKQFIVYPVWFYIQKSGAVCV